MPDILGTVRRALFTCLFLSGSLLACGFAQAEDSYVLALSWQPGFCAARPEAAECNPAPKDQPRLTLHGLWPQWDVNGDGKRDDDDDFCVLGDFNRKVIMGLDAGNWLELPPVVLSGAGSKDLERAMPGSRDGLDRHEWWKHGSCTGLKPEDYFGNAIALLRAVEQGSLARLLIDSAGGAIERKQLLDAFEADFGRGSARALMLDCRKEDGVTALQEIRIRLKRSRIAQALTPKSLAIPAKPARGDCAADVFVPAWPG
ncbi:hypothetical protein [Dongia sp.]|uniref:ribonuclease T2 family protein n=1 Tax=Dongia sp. TaxID=1977262 RepID=UPI003753526A